MGAFSDSAEKARSRTILADLGETITYRGAEGDVTTVGHVGLEADLFGGDVTSADERYVVSLLTEDVGEPFRGDRVTDEAGQVWELTDKKTGRDPHIVDWWVQRL